MDILEIYNLVEGVYGPEEVYTDYDDTELTRMSDEDIAKVATEFKTAVFEDWVISITDIFSFF